MRLLFGRLFVPVLIFCLLFASAAFAQEEEAARVTDIQIQGNKKVEAETIRSKMGVKVGDTFSPSRVRTDVAGIYKMGYFSDVQVEAEGYAGGLRLIFNVVERPIMRSFSFEGNQKLETSKLREKVNLTPYSVYNPSLVSENVERLKLFYQGEGYFNAQVLPITSEISKSEVKVIFQINEGDKVTIGKIEFTGNEEFSDRKLRKVMSTKRHIFLWSWITKSGTYKLLEFSQDIERIKALYYNNGYIQVSVGEPQVVLSEDKKSLTITIPIREGNQFRYRKIDLTGNTVFTSEELFEVVTSKPGDIMNREQLKDDVVALTDLYGTKGYAFATISPIVNPDVEAKEVDITLDVSEGEQIFVNRIDISGNVKTRDKVVRRELKFNEGEIYDTSSLKKSHERLRNLDFFEDVEIVPERTEKGNTVDLDVKVKEKSTGSFSIGGGYSTIDRLVAIGEVTQNNFLGLGQQLKFKGEFGKRRQNYVLSFTEPWLFDMPVSLRFDLYKEERVYTSYSKKSTGGGLSLGRRFWEYYGATASYSYSRESYFDVEEPAQPADTDLKIVEEPDLTDLLERTTTSKLGINLHRDSRDNYLDTRRGSSNSIYFEYSGKSIGGKNSFYKVIGDTTWFFPFFWDTAFSLHGRIGYADGLDGEELPLYERFYVGGISTVRGFDWGSLGPRSRIITLRRDPATNEYTIVESVEEGRELGGYKELIFNAEYTFPLLPEIKLRGVVFFDAGNAFGKDESIDISSLRTSVGGGFRWASPVGLIRLEYGYVLDKEPGEEGSKWEFSMGSMY